MSEAQFYTFLTGGLGLLTALMTLVAWHLWRMREDTRAGRISALGGVSHELRINLQRMVSELSQVAANPVIGPDVLLPIRHPQLDGVNASLINANRNGIAVIGVTYQELEARKLSLRAQLAQGNAPGNVLDDAMDAAINGIAALYFWEVHHGALPAEIGRVRSWDVRDWMKAHGFKADAFPGMHLRDEVVERLRMYGLELTPKPLTHTAWEYYNMSYDRHAERDARAEQRRARQAEKAEYELEEAAGDAAEDDKPRGFFGFRKKPAAGPAPVLEEADLAEAAPEAPAYTPAPPPRPPEPEVIDLSPEAVGDAPKAPA
jgi:hypothetical protein